MGRRGGGPGGECYNQPSVLESERSLEEWALPRILGCLTSRWFTGKCPLVHSPRWSPRQDRRGRGPT